MASIDSCTRCSSASPSANISHPKPTRIPSRSSYDLPVLADRPPMNVLHRPKIVLLGMMSKMPVAGVIWQTVHYLVGFKRLGYDVYYVEAHARTPSMFMEREDDDGSGRAAAFIDAVMRRFGFSGRWAYHALHEEGRCYGMSDSALRALYGSASLLINLH